MIISKKVNNNNKNIKIIAIKLQLKCMSIVLVEQSQTTQTHTHSNEKPIFLYGICISFCYVIHFFSSLLISCMIYAAAKIYSVQQHYLHIQKLIFSMYEIQYRNTLQMIIIYYYYYSLNLLETLILENIMHTQHTLQI